MIDYETFAKIRDCRDRQGLTIAQTARALGLHPQTVATWSARARFEQRRSRPRGSILDPFKTRITRLLDTHPYSAQQIFQRLREEGYGGGLTILRDYVRRIRPPDGLEQRRLNVRHHVRKILALAEIYPADAVARAISDGLAFQAFSAEYITNILEARARALPEPGPLQLTRRHDLLDIDIAPPDLNAYEVNDHDPE